MKEQFKKTIINVETKLEEKVNFTTDEIDYLLKERKIAEEIQATVKSELEAKKATRQAIADRLGLTADELQVLLG